MSNQLTTINNPYGAAVAPMGQPYSDAFEVAPMDQPHSTAVASAREAQEVQAMAIMAKRFPRDERAATDRILVACTRKGLADSAVYQYSRGSDISGPSIRLAETLARYWGNLDYGFRELEQRNGESTVETICWDIETNTRARRVFKVPHVRYTKSGGSIRLTDPRDIYEAIANNASRRLRACILEIIPGDVVDAAVAQCKATQEAAIKAEGKDIRELVNAMVEAFGKLNVDRKALEGYVGRSLDSVTPALLVRLRNVYKSIKDGIAQPSDYFDAVALRATEQEQKRTKRASAVAAVKAATTPATPAPEAPAKEYAIEAPAGEANAIDAIPMP